MSTFNPQFVTVAQSEQVSGTISFRNARRVGIWAPTVDSAQAFVQANYAKTNPTSAEFTRVAGTDGSGDFTWQVGPGSASVMLPEQFAGIPHARVELGVAQTSVRTFAVFGTT